MEFYTLNNGVKMPQLGFGVFQVTDPKIAEQAVSDALSVGYRLIDTAQAYGNEEAVGRAIAHSEVDREDLFITTKLWLSDTGYEASKRAFQSSMDKLGLEYLDLYLIHQPYGDIHGSWRAMEDLYKEGRIRAIGVSNFEPIHIADISLFNTVTPAVNQIEINPFQQQHNDVDFMKRSNVQPESWAPFAEGKNNLFTNHVLSDIGQRYGKSVGQVILRWLLQRGIVAIPKTVHKERMVENFDVFDFELTEAEMSEIATLDTGKSQFFDHRDTEEEMRLVGRNMFH